MRPEASQVLQEIVNISERYYALLPEKPDFLTYQDFLSQLPEHLRNYFQKKGYEASCRSPFFKRFVLEQKGWEKDRFMRIMLQERVYHIWRRQDVEATALLYQWLYPAETIAVY